MKTTKTFKKITISIFSAAYALSFLLSANALKPTPEQLESFRRPFVEAGICSDISKYPHIGYYAGLERLFKQLEYVDYALGLSTDVLPVWFNNCEDFERASEKQEKQISAVTKLINEIIEMQRYVARDFSDTSITTDDDKLSTFYEELNELFYLPNDEFISAAGNFTQKWKNEIVMSAESHAGSPIITFIPTFKNALAEAVRNVKLFLIGK